MRVEHLSQRLLPDTTMKKIFLSLAALFLLCQCSGFQPVKLEHDEDKGPPLDYRDGEWLPKNS